MPEQQDTRLITVGTQTVRVAQGGARRSARTLLVFNGIGASVETVAPFMAAFEHTRVLTFDVPGVGASPAPLLPYRMREVARLATGVLDAFDVAQADVFGVSWGGAAAQEFAIRQRARCRSLTLAATNAGMVMVPGNLAVLLRLLSPRRYLDPSYLMRIGGKLYGGLLRTEREVLRIHSHALRGPSQRGYFYQLLATVGWTSWHRLHRVTVPALVLMGSRRPDRAAGQRPHPRRRSATCDGRDHRLRPSFRAHTPARDRAARRALHRRRGHVRPDAQPQTARPLAARCRTRRNRMTYRAPLKDMLFTMQELAHIGAIAELPGFTEAGIDTAQAVLEECAKLNEGVIAPLNHEGDRSPSTWRDGAVTMTPGFKDAFEQFGAGGWQGLQHPVEYGGQGLPKLIGAACIEINNSANLSFALCSLLTDGAIEALLTAGTPAQQATWIPPMVEGRWTGTMNLTEPQAGSDLALVRTRAEPQGDGSYRIFGTKIFITYGEHDMAENIVHLVLARVTGAPAGVKGISLFIVPKFLLDANGAPGTRNDVQCVSIEHKLGIKASPTAVLQFGDGAFDNGHGAGAIGYLVGEENRGLEYMFIMMNAARFAVGVQGVAVAERAYQKAVAYARDRVQSRPVDGSTPEAAPIIRHPDVQRMLLTMRALTEGCRAMAAVTAAAYDVAHAHSDARHCRAEPRTVRVPRAAAQGLRHRVEPRGHEPRHPGPRRHGFHRGDRRRAVPARRAHPDDLRGHHGNPGQRPGRPQDPARRRTHCQGPRGAHRGHRGAAREVD